MKRLYLLFVVIFFPYSCATVQADDRFREVRAVYLSSGYLYSEKKISEMEEIIRNTSANGIVIDYKDSNIPKQELAISLVKRFRDSGAYTIARIVTFQDSYFARKRPDVAIKTGDGELWTSGLPKWQRYWLDPASLVAQDYTIDVAKQAIDAGFDEVQFDYIRFPADGNMKDIHYPFYDQRTSKAEIMKSFFAKLQTELKNYKPTIRLGIDVFGTVLSAGRISFIGQDLVDIAEYFDVICPMPYPSHYQCGEFSVSDPNAHPYLVYSYSLKIGRSYIPLSPSIFRPWIQDFSIRSIYRCGPKVNYGSKQVRAQISAGQEQGVQGFMLWNARSNFTIEAFH